MNGSIELKQLLDSEETLVTPDSVLPARRQREAVSRTLHSLESRLLNGPRAERDRHDAGGLGISQRNGTQNSKQKRKMKTTAVISILATALGLYGSPAQTTQTTPATPAGGKGAGAMQQAASANRYLFAFFYEKEDEATRAARKTFDEGVKKVTPAAESVAVDRSAAGEAEVVAKFGLDRAPMPLVLAIAPNGAVTGGIKGGDLSEGRLQDAVASPGLQRCLKGLQDRKLVFVCLQNGQTTGNEAAMKGVNEFKADAQLGQNTEIVKVDPSDAKEAKLLAQLKADPKAQTASTAMLAPPGMMVTKVDGPTSKADLQGALNRAMASCVPGSGCCPAPPK